VPTHIDHDVDVPADQVALCNCMIRYKTILDVQNGDDPLFTGSAVSRRDICTMLAGFARVFAPNQVPIHNVSNVMRALLIMNLNMIITYALMRFITALCHRHNNACY
jgi:hypothetical protein